MKYIPKEEFILEPEKIESHLLRIKVVERIGKGFINPRAAERIRINYGPVGALPVYDKDPN